MKDVVFKRRETMVYEPNQRATFSDEVAELLVLRGSVDIISPDIIRQEKPAQGRTK
jgi:hypothetical protein